ncbi:hypothetical protein CLV51_11134 [Chitinophaga niastensis]|uniref:Uncharacterized protein n=2 Tax=Chitinophaga niastensis TaxID=536980 RepID=A0A2P8H904_CHINA|nr:hypothetical protein CLV51_11134 [Chitinophaga niastensis]
MGKLASVELQEAPAEKCNKCNKPVKSMGCCKDEFKFCKVTESHQAAQALQQNFTMATDLQLPVKILPVPALSVQKILTGGYTHDPPDITTTPIFLQNCTFLI